jgi:plastocyanin
MRRTVVVGALVLAAGLVGGALTPAGAGSAGVDVEDTRFDPASVAVPVGGRVTWTWRGTSQPHNVRQARRLFRSGPVTSTSGTTFSRTFSAGTFPYRCEQHPVVMRGSVRVRPGASPAPIGRPFTVSWATGSTNVGEVFDVRFKVGSGDWRTWLTDTSATSKVFGRNGNPVTVRADTTYRFRARTQWSAAADARVSGWSPIRRFRI